MQNIWYVFADRTACFGRTTTDSITYFSLKGTRKNSVQQQICTKADKESANMLRVVLFYKNVQS